MVVVVMVAARSFAFGSEHEQSTLEGILGAYSLYHNGDMTSYAYRNPSNVAKVLAVCSVGIGAESEALPALRRVVWNIFTG